MQKSRYCRPSASRMFAPLPLTTNRGIPPTEWNARTGLSTPPTRLSRARLNSFSDSAARGATTASEPMSDPQAVDHLLGHGEEAGEDGGLPLRVLARFA